MCELGKTEEDRLRGCRNEGGRYRVRFVLRLAGMIFVERNNWVTGPLDWFEGMFAVFEDAVALFP